MDREMLVKLDGEGNVPSLLKKNWKMRHWCDPVAAAEKSLALERSAERVRRSAFIGAIFLFLVAIGLAVAMAPAAPTGPEGKLSSIETIVALLPFGGVITWFLAYLVSMVVGHESGQGALQKSLSEEAFQFGKHFSALQKAAGKSWSDLAKMDLKVLAEELLVDRAKLVRQAEGRAEKTPGILSYNAFLRHKLVYAEEFKSLFCILEELGLVAGDYGRFYKRAEKALKQEVAA